MTGSCSDEEEQGLVQRPPELLGLRFSDEEDRELVRKVTIASAGLVVLSVILASIHIHHLGDVSRAVAHTAVAMILPLIGYVGVRKESSRFIWVFHLGNVQFVVFHGVVALFLLQALIIVERTSAKEECEGELSNPEIYHTCLHRVQNLKGHIPAKVFLWSVMTFPLWACMIYAAYWANEYYLRLRIKSLSASAGEGGQATRTSARDIAINMGPSFSDEEDSDKVCKITIASAGLVVLSVILTIMHIHHSDDLSRAVVHTAFAMILPLIGYVGVQKESPRFIWVFHLGNVQFAIFHGVVVLFLLQAVIIVERTSTTEDCKGELTQPEIYQACLQRVQNLKHHIPAKLFWWSVMTFPLWACMIYAAYEAHGYYIRLRIKSLIAQAGEGGQATITSAKDETSNAAE